MSSSTGIRFQAGIVAFLVVVTLLAAAGSGRLAASKPKATPSGSTHEVNLADLEIEPTLHSDPGTQFKSILDLTMNQLAIQDAVEQTLQMELHSGDYSFEKPLVVVNPYMISPLSALAIFTTREPENIAIHIKGIDALSSVDFTFNGFNTEHLIPIYGLYPDTENTVILTARNQSGDQHEGHLRIQTEPLPAELKSVFILTDLPFPDRVQPGFNFTYLNGEGTYTKSAFDSNGAYRWFLSRCFSAGSALYSNGHYILTQDVRGNEKDPSWRVIFMEMNPLGRIYRVYYGIYGNHHDIEEYKGNLLVAGEQGSTKQDFIYEIDYQTGQTIHTLDLKQVLQRSRDAGYVTVEDPDWFHLNAITWDPADDTILVSGRNQSVVAKITWPEGRLVWILGSHNGWLPMFQKYLLNPVGSGFLWAYNQHAPEILPDQDGNPDTLDILLFDNGNQRFAVDPEIQRQIMANEIPVPERYSRMVQYRIDENRLTIEQVWQFGEQYGSTLYSPIRGEALLLPNGNRLGVFDIEIKNSPKAMNGSFFELLPNSAIAWSAQMISLLEPNGQHTEYMIDRMPIYRGDANALQIGIPAVNLIPMEVLTHYGY